MKRNSNTKWFSERTDLLGREPRRLNKLHLFILLVASMLVNFDNAVVIPIMANYSIVLGASSVLAGFIVGIYSIVHIPSNVFMGKLVDKYGSKTLLPVGILLDGFAMILYFFSTTPVFLLISRVVHGLGGGIGGPSTMSYLSDNLSKEQSGRGMALYGISLATSMLFGFIIGGVFAEIIGYQQLFISVAFILILMSFISSTLPIGYVPYKKITSIKEEIKIFVNTIISNVTILPYAAVFALYFNLGIITVSYAIIIGSVGFPPGQIGMLLAIMVLFSLILHYPSGIAGDRFGKPVITAIGLILTAFSFVVLSLSLQLQYAIFGMIILGLGHGLVFPNSAATVRDRSDEENRGIATGVFYALTVGGIAIGAPLSGFVYEIYGWQNALILGVVIPIFCTILYIFLRKKIRS
jgi:MFS family permease